MKAKKTLAGVLACTMVAALTVGSWSASAASQPTLLVSSTTSSAGAGFTVNVSMQDVPSGGVNSLDFAISYDSSVLTIQSVKLSTAMEDKVSGDTTTDAASALAYEIYDGEVDISFSTATAASSCITDESTIFMISGTVSGSAANGDYPLTIVPISRTQNSETSAMNTTVEVAAVSASDATVYDAILENGVVTVGEKSTTTHLLGDVNLDGSIDMSDVVFLCKAVSNVELGDEARITADCCVDAANTINTDDVLALLRFNVGLVTLPVYA